MENNLEKVCPNWEICPIREHLLQEMPWLDYYCKQNPEKCKRYRMLEEGSNPPASMLPDGTDTSCRVEKDVQ